MRLLQVVHSFPPDAWAGTELVTFHLAHALQTRGHQVTVLTRVEKPGAEEFSFLPERREGLDVIQVVNNYTRTATFQQSYDNDFFTDAFARLLERLRPEVVHFQHLAHLSINLLPLTARLGYPSVLSLHDFFFVCHLIHLIDRQGRICVGPEQGERCVSCLRDVGPADEIRQRFAHMSEVLQAPDVLLSPSQFLTQKLQEYFPFLESRLRTVPLGVKMPPQVKGRRPCGAPLRLLYAGVLMPHKGAHVLLEALRGLPQEAFEVSLYGMVVPFWQSYVDRLQETARGLPVRFCGVYPHEEVSTVLARHDVLVMPGVCEETFSLMTREALLAGLPVVAARRGALPEVIQDEENGLLFEPENAADLRRCLTRLINEPELVERLRAAPPRVKAIEAYAQDMEEIYAEVCAPAVRVPTLQRQLVVHSQKATALRQESEHLHAENTTLRAQVSALQERCCQIAAAKATVERERDSALLSMQEVSDRLCLREGQLQEREERLKAIYASTTWKLYRCYAALEHWVVHWPAAVLRRWLHK